MKNLLRLTLGASVLVGTGLLVAPEKVQGWSTIGGSLNLTQRDFRIFDNFNSAAHSNQNANANWPGYIEVELSVWKGGAEWGSRLHGDGSGDPTQNGVGDGKANFNFYWNGEASSGGGSNDNIVSGISGNGNGVLAFMQGPISDGWTVKFYKDSYTWRDNEGGISSGFDVQAVACHELGHALGLGHSTNSGATMAPSIASGSESERSINSDDQDGIQLGIYGFRDDNVLPRIADLTGSFVPGGTAVVTGANYTTTSNRIWFNSSTLNGGNSGGEPFELTNLNSTNGQTQICFTVPSSGIESGSIHVRKGGSGNDRLSESHPFELGRTCVGSDTMTLTGNTSASPGQMVSYSWTNAPDTGSWTIYYSLSENGNGCLDIGPSITAAGNGIASMPIFAGTVPNSTPTGITVFIEVQAVDDCGVEYDSNVVALAIN